MLSQYDRGHTDWSPAEDRRLLRLAGQGLTHAVIAERTGRSPSAISHRLCLLREFARRDEAARARWAAEPA